MSDPQSVEGASAIEDAAAGAAGGGSNIARSRRRSKRSRKARQGSGALRTMVARIDTRRMDGLVLAAALLPVVAAMALFHYERTFYPSIWLGATPTEVRYVFGEPSAVGTQGGAESWEYRRADYSESVLYEGGTATRLWCNSFGQGCPAMLGLQQGDVEDTLFSRLGVPDFQAIRGGTKIARYTGLGLEFALSRYQIDTITLTSAHGSFPGWLHRMVVFLLP